MTNAQATRSGQIGLRFVDCGGTPLAKRSCAAERRRWWGRASEDERLCCVWGDSWVASVELLVKARDQQQIHIAQHAFTEMT